jgi:hypothetical protein
LGVVDDPGAPIVAAVPPTQGLGHVALGREVHQLGLRGEHDLVSDLLSVVAVLVVTGKRGRRGGGDALRGHNAIGDAPLGPNDFAHGRQRTIIRIAGKPGDVTGIGLDPGGHGAATRKRATTLAS